MARRDERGHVYLIGAGPGDPKLLTLRAMEAIRGADVIVYDRLVSSEILASADKEAELIYVGKETGYHSIGQEEINAILIGKASEGQSVARLKGGDPFVFGRGAEEASALAREGIRFDIVPGVSSAAAVPAYAGIPITHRWKASSVAVVTGHEAPGKSETGVDWSKLATSVSTLVILMGLRHLEEIVAKLIEHGRAAKTPAAVIAWGTTPRQQTIVGNLTNISAKVAEGGVEAPAVIVIGEVVSFRDELKWFEKTPLFGKAVLITRPKEQAKPLVDALEALGAETVVFPTILLRPLDGYAQVDKAIEHLGEYDWVIFTSVNGVKAFFKRLRANGRDFRAFGKGKIAAIGPATADCLDKLGIAADMMPEQYQAEGLLAALEEEARKGARFLLPRAKVAREILPEKIKESGGAIDVVPVYETVENNKDTAAVKEAFASGSIDIVTFTSSSTVKNFVKLIGDEVLKESGAKTACIGPITADTARVLGIDVDMVAAEHTIAGLVEAIVSDAYERR